MACDGNSIGFACEFGLPWRQEPHPKTRADAVTSP